MTPARRSTGDASESSSAPHPADTHDLIRVRGARENNLKDSASTSQSAA